VTGLRKQLTTFSTLNETHNLFAYSSLQVTDHKYFCSSTACYVAGHSLHPCSLLLQTQSHLIHVYLLYIVTLAIRITLQEVCNTLCTYQYMSPDLTSNFTSLKVYNSKHTYAINFKFSPTILWTNGEVVWNTRSIIRWDVMLCYSWLRPKNWTPGFSNLCMPHYLPSKWLMRGFGLIWTK